MVRAWFPAKAVALRIIATIKRSGPSVAIGYVPRWFDVSIERVVAIERSRRGVAIGRSIAMRNSVAKRRGVSVSRPVLAY